MAKRVRLLTIVGWLLAAIGALLLVVVGWVALPIIVHEPQGVSSQQSIPEGEYVSWVAATGDDGRERVLSIFDETGTNPLVPEALASGQRVVVRGTGYDSSQGIYVALCVIAPDPETRPTPCVGGVPEATESETRVSDGSESQERVQWEASNWINSDWAWRLAGARDFGDRAQGNFTAYLQLPASDGEVDCSVQRCAIYTRNDHTASNDRVQDVHIPVRFVTAEQ